MNIEILGRELGKEVQEILKKQLPNTRICFYESNNEYVMLYQEQHNEICCVFQSGRAADELMNKGFRTLSCGFSSYDTLVMSSSTMEKAVVSLQRRIYTLSGQMLEPADYLIDKRNDYSDTALLFSVAVLLLLDCGKPMFYF